MGGDSNYLDVNSNNTKRIYRFFSYRKHIQGAHHYLDINPIAICKLRIQIRIPLESDIRVQPKLEMHHSMSHNLA